jgi:hypothetical protein
VNHPYEREPSERLTLLAAFVAAVAIVAGGLYIVLQKAVPISALPAAMQASKPEQSALPASNPTAPAAASKPTVSTEEFDKGPTVYRCLVNGAATYSDAPCPGGKLVDARPASSGFTPQRPQPTARVAQATSTAPMSTASVALTSASEKTKREARCAWIEAEIERIDALARQGQSAASQDWLRETRRKLVDEKYTLKC